MQAHQAAALADLDDHVVVALVHDQPRVAVAAAQPGDLAGLVEGQLHVLIIGSDDQETQRIR
jgi:hypothetical protein